jgi:hypothetical protein
MIGADVKLPGTADVDEGNGKPGKTCADAMDPAARTTTTAKTAAQRPAPLNLGRRRTRPKPRLFLDSAAMLTRSYQVKLRAPSSKAAALYSNFVVRKNRIIFPVIR